MKALFLLPFLFLALAVVLLAADRPTNQPTLNSASHAPREGCNVGSVLLALLCRFVPASLASTEAALWPLQGYIPSGLELSLELSSFQTLARELLPQEPR